MNGPKPFKIGFAFFSTAMLLCVWCCVPKCCCFSHTFGAAAAAAAAAMVACCLYSFVSVFAANNYQQNANFTSGWNAFFSRVSLFILYFKFPLLAMLLYGIGLMLLVFFVCMCEWILKTEALVKRKSFKYLLVTTMWFDSHCFIAWLGIYVLFHPLPQYVWLFQIFCPQKTIWNQLTSVISGACVRVHSNDDFESQTSLFSSVNHPYHSNEKRKFWQIFNRWLSIPCGLTTKQ